MRGGDHGPAIEPGHPEASLLLAVVTGTHAELERMPRKRPPLGDGEIQSLRVWIAAGAPWPVHGSIAPDAPPPHLAFQPVRRPDLPSGDGHPIDRFVRARLGAEGLSPSPTAEPATLVRRVSLDLTGLPPTPEEVDSFLADRSEDAYLRLVERLLASPHHGEKWARHWLDTARYADSNGFEKDRTRSIWPYRDWVIHALNDDLPFDRFTRDQLAGDLIPDATPAQRIATGFLRNSMINMEGGVEPEKFRVETIIDRVDAVGRTWLGLTVACAQCHSHKYDPVSIREYYQFYDFLNQDVEPVEDVPSPATAARRKAIESAVRALEDRWLEDPPVAEGFGRWLDTMRGLPARLPIWEPLDAREWHSTPMKYEKQEDLSLLGGGDIHNSSVVRVWVDLPDPRLTGVRLEVLNHGNLPNDGPGLAGNGDFLIDEFTVEVTPLAELQTPDAGSEGFSATTNRVAFREVRADIEADGLPASRLIDGEHTNGGWGAGFTRGRRNQEHRVVFGASEPFGFPGGSRLLLTVHAKPGPGLNNSSDRVSNFIPGRLRLSVTRDSGPLTVDPLSERQRRWLDRLGAGGDSLPVRPGDPVDIASVRRELFRVFLFQEPSLADLARQWDAAWKDWPATENTTLVLRDRPARRDTRIFRRGDWQRPTEPVTADVPAVLNPFPPDAPRNRLGLAAWLTHPDNPLTARVTVNRVWQQYFGTGLVSTPEDFGVRSDPPSHPELLDWLAAEFQSPTAGVAPPWSLRHLHRLIVTSATYRQSSRVTPGLFERDPSNRLLARGPRVRVDAETVFDIALRASGLLSPKVGGPSVFPPLPDGVMALAYGPIPWNVSTGDDRYRRAMYTFWKRSVPHPALLTFDAPSAEQSCVRRLRSNTPLQALVTLNEPTFLQAARWLAWSTLQGASDDTTRIELAFRRCVSRRPGPEERRAIQSLLDDARAAFAAGTSDAARFAHADPANPAPLPPGSGTVDLAAWTVVSRALLNLDETLTKE